MASKQHNELSEVHLELYNRLKKKALSYEFGHSSVLKKYRQNLESNSKRDFSKSNEKELLSSLKESQIIFIGDIHTFDQNSRNVERLWRYINEENDRPMALGIEFVQSSDQKFIDLYLNRHISELEFLEMINYIESWRFPWNHYRLFFENARKHNTPIIALNSQGGLKERDQFAAKKIDDFFKINPDYRMIVFFGEMHISPNMLPAIVKKYCPLKQTIVHQNLDEVYWKLKNKSPQILKFNPNEFVLHTSAPWIKYESMIYWYENLSEDPDFDLHEYILETGAKSLSDNSSEHFIFILNTILKTLGQKKIPKEIHYEIELIDFRQMKKAFGQIKKLKNQETKQFYLNLLQNNQKFKIPYKELFYCPHYSINNLSFLVGTFIFHYLLKLSTGHDEDIVNEGSKLEKFIYFFHLNFFSYLTNKIINPHRKCNLYIDLLLLAAHTKGNEKKLLTKTIIILETPEEIETIIKSLSLEDCHSVAKQTSYVLADLTYSLIINKKTKSIGHLLPTFLNPNLDKSGLLEIFKLIRSKVEIIKTQKAYF